MEAVFPSEAWENRKNSLPKDICFRIQERLPKYGGKIYENPLACLPDSHPDPACADWCQQPRFVNQHKPN
jgi:hypothetical protein